MIEAHIRTPRTARFYATGSVTAATRELWVACHGYAQLARFFIRAFAGIADEQRVVIAPEALNRYYFETAPGVHGPDARVAATWMTREDREHEMADYIEYLDNVVAHVAGESGAGVHVTAFGFSQGAATVSRWAARGRTPIDHVVLWAAGLPPELQAGADLFRGARVTLAAGSADPHVAEERAAAEQARLAAAGVHCRLFRYDGAHRVDADALQQLVRASSP